LAIYIENLRILSQTWWFTLVIPVLGRLRREDCKLEASVGFIFKLETILHSKTPQEEKKKKLRIVHNLWPQNSTLKNSLKVKIIDIGKD
jgi:hypothetical protein